MTAPDWGHLWPVPAFAFLLTALGTRRVLVWLVERQYLDRPNERSSHTVPTPRGGGLAVSPAVLAAWVMAGTMPGGAIPVWAWVLVGGAAVLMALSWADDRFDLPVLPRFLTHAGCIAAALYAIGPDLMVFQGWLPLWADRAVALLGWLWFVNLYNFMDGIDGITGVETASLGVGIAAVAVTAAILTEVVPLSLACAAAGAAFLLFNWHPARIFLGDAGSVPLGYLLGGMLVLLAANGQLAAALILPAYYLADATLTMGKRALRGEKFWKPHRQHFYQRAVQGGKRHDQVARLVLGGNLVLMAAALMAAGGHTLAGLGLGILTVTAMLGIMQRWARG